MSAQTTMAFTDSVRELIIQPLNVTLLPESIQKKITFQTCPIPGLSGKCWVFTKNLNPDGYARIWWNGRQYRSHRLIYELLVGAIPSGLGLDHLCREKACSNPAHLEAVTQRENTKRGLGIGVFNAALTHCRRGHEFTYKNTMMWRGKRWCRACGHIRQEAYEARKAQAVSA